MKVKEDLGGEKVRIFQGVAFQVAEALRKDGRHLVRRNVPA
jgi:hypothetical protein